MRSLILLLFFIYTCTSYAQNPLLKIWDKRIGGPLLDKLEDMKPTRDRGYILCGSTYSGIGGNKEQPCWGNTDYWIVKVAGNGSLQWEKRFGGVPVDKCHSVNQTSDGGYIIGGWSGSIVEGDKTAPHRGLGGWDYWIVKTDSLGNKEWDNGFGGIYDDELYCVIQTSDGGYLLGGSSNSPVGYDKTVPLNGGYNFDFWIVKTDSQGNKIWDKSYGCRTEDHLYQLIKTDDGGYLLGGYSSTIPALDSGKSELGYGSDDYWILKIDSAGNRQWDKSYGGTYIDHLTSLRQTKDGGYILGGKSNSPASGCKTENSWGYDDYWIIKINSVGNIQWDKNFGGNDADYLQSIFQTHDNGYLLTGQSRSSINGNKTSDLTSQLQTWIVKTDSSGILKWDKTLQTNDWVTYDIGGIGVQNTDGSYIFANTTSDIAGGEKTESSRDTGSYAYSAGDFWIIKFRDTTQALPVANFELTDISVCEGMDVCKDFMDMSMGEIGSWDWQFRGAIPTSSNLQNPHNICYHNSGLYPVTLTVFNASGSDSMQADFTLEIFQKPVALVLKDDNTLSTGSGFNYQWYFNDLPISGVTESFYNVKECGDYYVSVTDTNGCNAISQKTTITGIGKWLVHPNPAHDEIILNTNYIPCGDNYLLSVCNSIGKKILEKEIASPYYDHLDISTFSSGTYFIRISDGNNTNILSFIKY